MTEHRIGLRFDHRDAGKLQELAERAKLRELGPDSQATFALAAEAASTGEPLIVICTTPMEAILMAQGYTRFGVRVPTVESLSGGG